MTEKEDGPLYNFHRQFVDSLAVEYRFVEDVAHGLANNRPDAVQRHMNALLTVVGIVGSNLAPMGGGVINFITGCAKKYIQDKNDQKTGKMQSELTKHAPDKRLMLFEQIAKEVMYRYGACILHLVGNVSSHNSTQAIDRLARTGAIRIIYYALKHNISFEHCERLVKGLVEGFDGFPEQDLLSRLTEGPFEWFDSNKNKISFSCEGVYTRCGFFTPGSRFWIHSDFDRQKGENGRRGGYVSFNKTAGEGGYFSSVSSTLGVNIDKREREDKLVPTYGYIAVPDEGIPRGYGFRKHNPLTSENDHANISIQYRYRYVSLQHIVDYLIAMKAQFGEDDRTDFNDWLTTQSSAYSREFKMKTGFKIKALFRGCIDHNHLTTHNVSFSDGTFPDVDFSYTAFSGVSIKNLQRSRLVGCSFSGCIATGAAISGSDLSLSKIEGCTFEGLNGIITLNFGTLAKTSFAGCTFTVTNFNGMDYDADTLQSFSTSVAKSSTSAPDERLYEMLLETKMKQDKMHELLREKEDLLRQAELDRVTTRDLLTNLREVDFQKDAKQNTRVSSVEDQVERLKQRLDAFDQGTLGNSISLIRPPPGSEDNPITKIFEVLFFLKPVKLLKLLQKNPHVVKWNQLPRNFYYSTNGIEGEAGHAGEDGMPGAAGGGSGTDGVSGVNGQHGTSANLNTVCLMSVPGQRIFVISPKANDVDASILPLYDGTVKINLSARGGDGGKGGNGGKGGDGRDGMNGRNAHGGVAGTAGTAGGNGGRGGNGGNGGNAGNSADIAVMVKEEDMDLLSLLGTMTNDQPKGGLKGDFGLGGRGGSGGRGGAGGSFHNGDRIVNVQGGPNGPDGVAGNNGRDGQYGQNGVKGNIQISVVDLVTGDVEEFPSIYKFHLKRIAPFYSITGIIEPGQTVEVTSFELENSGGMPTPKTNMQVTMKGNTLVVVDEKNASWTVNEKIYPGKNTEINTPLAFKIASGLKASNITEVLYATSQLRLDATFPRTMLAFKDFQTFPIPIAIMHPIEISVVMGAKAAVFQWGVPITITVRNKTRVAFGSGAAYGRLVRVTVDLPDEAVNHKWHTNNSGLGSKLTAYTMKSQVVYDIDFLAPLSEQHIVGVLQVEEDCATLYDQIKITYSLHLGDIERPLDPTGLELIQQKHHTVQVGEYCKPIGDNDCVLIVSGTTTLAEVEYWREVFRKLDKGMVVWNVALYHGASYSVADPLFNFNSNLQSKIVVVLNKPYFRDDNMEYVDKEFYPMDFFEQSEAFEAARRRGVRTLIVNYVSQKQPKSTHHDSFDRYCVPFAAYEGDLSAPSTFDGREKLYDSVRNAGIERDEKLEEKYEYCRIKMFRLISAPKEEDFDTRMEQLAEKIRICRPDRQYFLAKAYEKATKGSDVRGLLFRRFDCGGIELRRGLDTTYAVIASTTVRITHPTERSQTVMAWALLKLLPLTKKLEMFVSTDPKVSMHYQVLLAIASDIADEQSVFLDCVRELAVLGPKKERMGGWLIALDILEKYDFSDLTAKEGGKDALQELLMKVSFMAAQYRKVLMIKSSFLAVAVHDTCFAVMKSYLNVLTEPEFKSALNEYTKKQRLSKNDDIMGKVKDPHAIYDEIFFNHWISIPKNIVHGTQKLKDPPTLSTMQRSLPNVMFSEAELKKAVTFFTQAPKYHFQPLPNLYPVKPGMNLLTDKGNPKGSYFVRGQLLFKDNTTLDTSSKSNYEAEASAKLLPTPVASPVAPASSGLGSLAKSFSKMGSGLFSGKSGNGTSGGVSAIAEESDPTSPDTVATDLTPAKP